MTDEITSSLETRVTAADHEHRKTIQSFAIWAKYEDIAMHFNDLAMRFRLQALAGVGAATLAAGGIFTHGDGLHLRPLGAFLFALGLIWLGIWLMDVFYYQQLLHGAVEAIKCREQVAIWKVEGEKGLSANIEKAVQGGRMSGATARKAFYGIVLTLLVGGGGLLFCFA